MGELTLFLFKSERIFPHFNLYPLTDNLSMPLMKYKKVDLKSNRNFKNLFSLKGIDPEETRNVFTETAVNKLEEIKNIYIEARSNYFLVFCNGLNLTKEHVNMFLPYAKSTFEAFKQ